MAGVLKGRYMADVSRLGDEVVVFVIGMRINKPLKVGLWWPVFNGMFWGLESICAWRVSSRHDALTRRSGHQLLRAVVQAGS